LVQDIRELGGCHEHHKSVHEGGALFLVALECLKLNFTEWQRRVVSRRLIRIAADIEASKVFWRD